MHDSGTDTHDLAIAAKAQADAAKTQADRTKDLADRALVQANATNELARQSKRSADANKESADAAKSAADTASSQLELSERPWVDAEISIDGPFDFNVNGGNIHLKFRLLNTGHSPALTTVIQALPVDSAFTGIGDPAEYRDQVCRSATDMILKYPSEGVALFPNSTFEQGGTWTFSNEELSKTHGKGSRMPGVIIWPSVVVCIAYRPPFNQNDIYHTSYIFDLIKVDASNRTSVDFKIGEDIDRDHLRLQCHTAKCITAD